MNSGKKHEQLHDISASLPGAVYQFVVDKNNQYQMAYISESAKQLFNRSTAELKDAVKIFKDVHPDDIAGFMKAIEVSKQTLGKWSYTFRLIEKNKSIKWIQGISNPRKQSDGSVLWNGVLFDVTDIKRTMKEKEILLRELYHRTKNNMQVICGYLHLQRMYSPSPEVQNHLREAENRIKTMSLVHSKLYQSRDLSNIYLDEYIIELMDLLKKSYCPAECQIILHKTIESIKVIIDVAIPVGLIINELLSNCFKHAFPALKGNIWITINQEHESTIYINVKDDGVGVPRGFDVNTAGSMGLQIVRNIVNLQLQGSIAFHIQKGFSCTIIFDNTLYRERI